jgi:nitrogen-specific signal transduction histidine kinase
MLPITLDVRRNTGSFFAAGTSGGLHYLITLIDVSEMFRIKDEVKKDKEPSPDENMVGLVTEMAHQVRNPLTTIRGAGELISSAVEATLAEKGQLTPDDWETLRTMCQLISEQTQELDSKVSRLMHLAVDEPEKLETLLDESDRWRQKVAPVQGKSEKNVPLNPSSLEECSDG